MPQITLTVEQVREMQSIADRNGLKTFFVAKDHGAYVGVSAGADPEKKCIYYFRGMDPHKDKNWHDNTRGAFGGDDFGENFSISLLSRMLSDVTNKKLRIIVTPTQLKMEILR